MILDNIKNMEQYSMVHPLFRKAFAAIRELVESDAPVGKYEIDGNKVFALVQKYEPTPVGEKLFELHHKYIDIQFVVSGSEEMHIKNCYGLEPVVPYNEEKDVEMYAEAKRYATVHLGAGHYAVLFPHETHRPGVLVEGEPCEVKKIVVKVLA